MARIEPAPLEQPLHPRGDPREHDADLVIRRGRQRPELERVSLAGRVEHAVEEQRVEMDVQVQSTRHSQGEERFVLLGQSDRGRLLVVMSLSAARQFI